MARVTHITCDQCRETIREGSRLLRFTGKVVAMNGGSREAQSVPEDFCSEACVLGRVRALLGEAVGT
jgi:hypothetical protein